MKTHAVSSGTFKISTRAPLVLQAFLGSCVGVTLCDRKAGIGGLIHLLLPEPPSIDPTWNPEVSAATGMPIFIDALCREGAQLERLEACIGGGALMDPVSQSDLLLDIGGRTAEMVQQILSDAKIPIKQSEIGGYFSCCMGLDLQTLETTIEPAIIPMHKMLTDCAISSPRGQLDKVIDGLSPVPQTALKLIRMINCANSSFHEISNEVCQDQVLSARIIKLCNSVSINSRMKVDSIEKALIRIGEKHLLLIALSFSLESFISQASHGYSLCKGGIFHHSVWTANICRNLAEITCKAQPDIAYTAGLLHDIGKVVLDQFMSDAHPLFYRQSQTVNGDLTAMERELFGITHTEAGHRLASRWDMPEFITDTILHHHQPEKAVIAGELAHLVYTADLISSRFLLGHEIENMNTTRLRTSLDVIGFDLDELPALLAGIPSMASLIFNNTGFNTDRVPLAPPTSAHEPSVLH
ncbi:MAG: HDOD domain-containing protein [Syntrophobacteraceae bacterium]